MRKYVPNSSSSQGGYGGEAMKKYKTDSQIYLGYVARKHRLVFVNGMLNALSKDTGISKRRIKKRMKKEMIDLELWK